MNFERGYQGNNPEIGRNSKYRSKILTPRLREDEFRFAKRTRWIEDRRIIHEIYSPYWFDSVYDLVKDLQVYVHGPRSIRQRREISRDTTFPLIISLSQGRACALPVWNSRNLMNGVRMWLEWNYFWKSCNFHNYPAFSNSRTGAPKSLINYGPESHGNQCEECREND